MKKLLAFENLCLLLLLLFVYFYVFHFSLGWLLVGILIPDLSMIGYLHNNKTGAYLYNIFHSFILPTFMLIFGIIYQLDIYLTVSLIWFIHIFIDRMFSLGLKFTKGFKMTHLG